MNPLPLGLLPLSWSWIAAAVSSVGAVSCLIWWLVRKRDVRVKLPTVRILEMERQVLPRLQLAPPPWVPFLCFALLTVLLVFFALRPTERLYSESDPQRAKVHILVDLTASVSAVSSLEEVALQTASIYEKLAPLSTVTLSHTASSVVIKPSSAEMVQNFIKTEGWQRSGARIGDAVGDILAKEHGLDRLLILSDRDSSSWGGFSWQALQQEVRVERLEWPEKTSAANVFINRVERVAQMDTKTIAFDIELLRIGVSKQVGKISGSIGDKKLWSGTWNLEGERGRVVLRLMAAKAAVESAANELGGGSDGKVNVESRFSSMIRWVVEPEGGDSLALDNSFYSELALHRQKTLVVAEAEGERMMDDSVGSLMVALEVLGVNPTRHDRPSTSPKGEALRIILPPLAGKSGDKTFCPTMHDTGAGKEGQSSAAKTTWTWLAPRALDDDFGRLCRCLAQLRREGDGYCNSVTHRGSWVGLLSSIGGKQVGGSLGVAQDALAYAFSPNVAGERLLAFTVPLMPIPSMGLTHARFPLLLRDLLGFSGALVTQEMSRNSADAWPRIINIWDLINDAVDGRLSVPTEKLALANIPLGESLGTLAETKELPPIAEIGAANFSQALSPRQERETADRWITGLICFVLLVLGFESLHAWRFFTKQRQREVLGNALFLIAFLASAGMNQAAAAKTDLVQSGYNGAAMTFVTLAKETQGRTSLSVNSQPISVNLSSTGELAKQGWLWVNGAESLKDSSGALKGEVLQWIRRGGFLVIERMQNREALERLTAPLFLKSKNPNHWDPIPPDHEMMRSFYLLDSLPQCSDSNMPTPWYGLEFDGRLAVLAIPYSLMEVVQDRPPSGACRGNAEIERNVRTFINIILVSLTMDYKKDQIHLPEILKRLR